MDKVRGRCYECVKEEMRERTGPTPKTRDAMPRSNPMAAKKCNCGRKLILEMDKVRGRCYECVKEESQERTKPRKRGGKRDN